MVCLIQGKLSIITGSAQGLGKAFAVRLLAAGAKVVATIIVIWFMIIWFMVTAFAFMVVGFKVNVFVGVIVSITAVHCQLQSVTVTVCVLSTDVVIITNILINRSTSSS